MPTVKAAVFYEAGNPLKIEDVPTPEVGPNDILIKVAACGVCRTDLHYLHGTPTFKKPPLILGHEASGTITEMGSAVENWTKGDRVLIPAVLSCGFCDNCRLGRENVCQRQEMVGNNIDGAYAEYIRVPAKDVFRIPDSLALEETSIVADAISTPYHAVKNRGEVRPGDLVAVFGCGGVGINVVQIAAAAGGIVYAVDIDDKKLQLAEKLGASVTINSKDENPVTQIRAITKKRGVDVSFEVIGIPDVMNQALAVVRWGGRMVVVGYAESDWTVSASRIMFREVEIRGSLGCRPVDYPPLLRMVEKDIIQIKPIIDGKRPLEEINDASKLLEEGKVLGRIIVIP